MKDVSLQFTDKQQYNDIVINSGWLDTNQQTVFINDIGFVLVFDDPESDTPVLIEKKGYYVNMRITGDDVDLSPLKKFIIPDPGVRAWA
ncbi:hypothetical protein [Escherichia coli]|uniref:hypothetical protein n=1 Tax=Escherichia coli TaxID=562 RepID=UPI000BF32F70|nr:hypothetical protein [Escherichia coli]MCU7713393.1 hypothetical protein [Escherichia coli]MDH6812584.1 hypothetical protein [Escherichia coli]PGF92816.1 hypothetical protein BMR25_21840 [Escherichia coli]HAM7397790.1 hypothetical protein [Escherichia coli]